MFALIFLLPGHMSGALDKHVIIMVSRVRQYGVCNAVRWKSEPGKAVAGSRYTALEPEP